MNTFHSPSPLNHTDILDLSVVIPCYNEAESIEAVLRSWVSVIDRAVPSYEIILINDGSSDGTGRILDKLRRELKFLRVVHQLNSGHAKAVRRGYEIARGRYILQLDSNGLYEASLFHTLWEKRTSYDLILGDRSFAFENFFRRAVTKALLRWAALLFKSYLRDPNSPLRLFRREVGADYLQLLPESIQGVNFSLSLMTQREHPERVTELQIPTKTRPRMRSRTPASGFLRASLPLFFDLLRLRFSFRNGSPQQPFQQGHAQST